MFDFYFWIAIFVTGILVAFGHYLPLTRRTLHPVICYACGVSLLLLGMGIWLGLGLEQWILYGSLWAFALAGGLADVLCYGIDAIQNRSIAHDTLERSTHLTRVETVTRTKVENIIGCLVNVDDHLRVSLLRLAQWARTEEDREIIGEVIEARIKAAEAHELVLHFHRDKREEALSEKST